MKRKHRLSVLPGAGVYPFRDDAAELADIREDMIDRIGQIVRTLPLRDLPGLLHALARFERREVQHGDDNPMEPA